MSGGRALAHRQLFRELRGQNVRHDAVAVLAQEFPDLAALLGRPVWSAHLGGGGGGQQLARSRQATFPGWAKADISDRSDPPTQLPSPVVRV